MHNERFPLLLPGWTNYNKTIQYHNFDVTSTLNSYVNHTIGVIVAPGWYSGYIGPGKNHSLYGDKSSFLLELHIEFSNGSKLIISSDDTWKVGTGPLVYSDLIHGEVFYENRQNDDWLSYNFNDSNWFQVVTEPVNRNVKLLSDSVAPDISALKTRIKCSNFWKVDNDTWVYQFKKLITGKINFIVSDFLHNARIQVRYAEAVYPNGSIYIQNHGSALDTDVFLLNGKS